MSQSLSRVLVHMVFGTKHLSPDLRPEVREALHPYFVTVLDDIGCVSLRVGGVEDHAHMLFGLSRTATIAQVAETVKTSSSKWIKTKGWGLDQFAWQGGYGAFSVSESAANTVVRYIRDQEQRHRKMTFQEEYRELLKRHGIPFDERYLWD